jgi:hypothetical protein
MFNHEFFLSRTWRTGLVNFTRQRKIPAPVVEIHCLDGSSFKLARLRPKKTYVVVEAYGHNGKTSIKFIPYEQIKHIEFMEESEEGRGRHTIKALPTSVTYDEDFLGSYRPTPGRLVRMPVQDVSCRRETAFDSPLVFDNMLA